MRPPTQWQRLLHWWKIRYSKTLRWWRNSNSNCLRHWLFPHIWLQHRKPIAPPFPKWYGMPTTKPLFLTQVVTYKFEEYYAGVQDLNQTMSATKHMSVSISADMLPSLPHAVSSMFLNNARFASGGISVLSFLITHPNSSSRKNILLAISYLTFLEMEVGESSIDFMPRVRDVSQRLKGLSMEK